MESFFFSFWWLLFPIGFFIFGAWDRWLAYQRSKDRLGAVRHGPRGRGGGTGQPQAQVVALDDGHGRAELLDEAEPQRPGVEPHRAVDVVDDVADLRHALPLPYRLSSA